MRCHRHRRRVLGLPARHRRSRRRHLPPRSVGWPRRAPGCSLRCPARLTHGRGLAPAKVVPALGLAAIVDKVCKADKFVGQTFSNAIRAPVAPATAATLEATTVLQGQVEASPAHVGSSPKQLVQTPLTVGKNKRKSHSTSQRAIPDSRDPVPMQQRTHNSANAQTITSTDVEHNISKIRKRTM